MSNWLAIVISFTWVFVALGTAEGLRKRFHYRLEFTRKFIHIAIGMWSIGTVYLFQNKWVAIILPIVFIVLNYIFYKKNVFKAMETHDEHNHNKQQPTPNPNNNEDGSEDHKTDNEKKADKNNKTNLGIVYFPIAFCLIILLLWDWPDRVVAALMPLTWGDAMAAILGRRYGHISYTILNNSRSIEGSISMLLFSLISTFLALWLIPPLTTPLLSLGVAVVIAITATVIEAISPWGTDNLTIPAISGLILYLWQF